MKREIDFDEGVVPEGFIPLRYGGVYAGEWFAASCGPVLASMVHDGPCLVLKRDEPLAIKACRAFMLLAGFIVESGPIKEAKWLAEQAVKEWEASANAPA